MHGGRLVPPVLGLPQSASTNALEMAAQRRRPPDGRRQGGHGGERDGRHRGGEPRARGAKGGKAAAPTSRLGNSIAQNSAYELPAAFRGRRAQCLICILISNIVIRKAPPRRWSTVITREVCRSRGENARSRRWAAGCLERGIHAACCTACRRARHGTADALGQRCVAGLR